MIHTQICKNLCLLLTAVLHFIHSMVQPVLMSLSASRSSNRASHVRVCLLFYILFLVRDNDEMATIIMAMSFLMTYIL